jgi:heme A synthase
VPGDWSAISAGSSALECRPGRRRIATASGNPFLDPVRRLVTRFQKLAAATVVTAILLVTIGVIVRVTGSGLGCPDWPLCHGQIIPPLNDPQAWIEWVHRTVAALIGFLVLGLAFVAFRERRERPGLLWASLVVVGLVGFQAWLGRETVRLNKSGESVTAHLAAAMALVGLLVFILVRSL